MEDQLLIRRREDWPHLLQLASVFTRHCLHRREVPSSGGIINLSYNENPLGPSPKAIEGMCSVSAHLHRYPNVSSPFLRAEVAAHYGIKVDQVCIGSGATYFIGLIALAAITPSSNALISTGSLYSYEMASSIAGADVRFVPLTPEMHHDLPALADAITAETAVIFIANPNNPTGLYFSPSELARFVQAVPQSCLLVIDEAYIHFIRELTDEDYWLRWATSSHNTLVLRTYSKVFGLAGLRLGFAVGNERLIQTIEVFQRLVDPGAVSLLAEFAGIHALRDEEHIHASRRHVHALMDSAADRLRSRGIRVTASQTNFLFAYLGTRAQALTQYLEEHDVIVTNCDVMGLPGWIRFCIGTTKDMDRLLTLVEYALDQTKTG